MGSYLVEKSVVLQNKRIVSEDSASDIPILMMHGELLLTSTDTQNENNDLRIIFNEHLITQASHTECFDPLLNLGHNIL